MLSHSSPWSAPTHLRSRTDPSLATCSPLNSSKPLPSSASPPRACSFHRQRLSLPQTPQPLSATRAPATQPVTISLPVSSIPRSRSCSSLRRAESSICRAAASDAVPEGPFSGALRRVRGLFWSPYDAEIWAVAIPALCAMMLDPIMGVINSALVGQLGVAQLSAVSMGSLCVSLCTFVFSFLLFITVPEVAAAVAAKNDDKVSEVASRGIWIAASLGIGAATCVFFGAENIVSAMKPADSEVAMYALQLIKIRAFGMVAALVGFVASGTYRGFKDTKTPLTVALTTTVTSLSLNFLFIRGLEWGVNGSGLATVISSWVSCLTLCYQLVKKGRLRVDDLYKPPAMSAVWPVLRAGSVLALRNIISFGMIVYASMLCVRGGTIYQASFEVLRQIWIMTAQAFECLNVATQALCATYLGMGDRENARAIMIRLATLGVMIAFCASFFVFMMKAPFVGLFTSDPNLIAEVFGALPLLCFFFPFDAMASIMDGSLMASRQTDFLSFVQIGGAFIQYGLLMHLASNSLVTTLSIWSILKLLTVFRMSGGVYRNFFSDKSAYLVQKAA